MRRKVVLPASLERIHRVLWTAQPGARALDAGQEALEVRLTALASGLAVTKIYTFRRNSYVVDVALEIKNNGAAPIKPRAYFQLSHDGQQEKRSSSLADTFGAQSFFGFAVYTEQKKFQKIALSDIDKGKPDYVRRRKTAGSALSNTTLSLPGCRAATAVREYARSSLLKKATTRARAGTDAGCRARRRRTRQRSDLCGPQEHRRLTAAASGLDYAVDYGWLSIIAWPLFWILEQFHALSGNWGWRSSC
jgi:YidC/Oxa1 family membrane protein insertase